MGDDLNKETDKKPVALVTGATRGIGLAVTRRLLERGCLVVGCYAGNHTAAENARHELGLLAGDFITVHADISGDAGIETVAEVIDRHGRLDYLISNVGITDKTPFGAVTREKWNKVLDTNLTAPFFLVQRLARYLRDDEGRIILIGAVMGIRPHPMSFSYGASKAGLHFLGQSLVKVMSPRGITVNVIAPGFIETDMQIDKAQEHRRRVENKISLRRFGSPDEVAAAVASLLDQPYITGQVLCVDGGYDFE